MKYLFVFCTLFLFSCNTNVERHDTNVKIDGADIRIVVIDGHEYYSSYYIGADNSFLCHNESCPNPIHKCPCK